MLEGGLMETIICPTCKYENPPIAKFCMNCGEPFQAAAPPVAEDKATRKLEQTPTPPDTSTIHLAPVEETAAKDSSTVRLSAEELAKAAEELQAGEPQRDFSTVKLDASELAKAAEELKAGEPPRDFSTVKLDAGELAKAAEELQAGEPQRDFSTVKLDASELGKAAEELKSSEPQKDFSTVRLEPVSPPAEADEGPAVEEEAPSPPKRFCPNCGREVKPGTKFCDDCGTRMDEAPGTVPPKPPVVALKPEPPPPAAPPEVPPEKPPRRRRRTGCIIGVILLCLLVAAATVTIYIYWDDIKGLLGMETATPVAQVVETASRPSATPRPTDTQTPTPTITLTPTPTLTPTATPIPERTLTICMGDEPDTLYPYGGSMLAASNILDAIYDGPIDSRGYAYQAIILEKLPSLADGDAVLETITVRSGDRVVNTDGEQVTLLSGVWVRPSGCRTADCAVEYNGGSLEMDRLVVTFHLLPGLTWSDGEPLTAADSLYSYQLAADPDTPISKFVIDRTEVYEAVDELTTIWTGIPGYLDATYFLNFWTPYPEHLWGRYSANDLIDEVDDRELWLGWGPYIIDEWDIGYQITLSRNPNYFRADEGLPHFTTLIYRFVGQDSSSNIAALVSGDCDILNQTTNISEQAGMLLDLDAAGQLNAEFVTGTTWEHADFNIQPVASYRNSGSFAGWDTDRNGRGPFGDVRLRQAVAMCMDRQAVVDAVFFGQSIVIDAYIPPEHPLYNPHNSSWQYDPEAAGILLDEIGWLDTDGNSSTPRLARNVEGVPNGTPLSFAYETTTATQRQQATQIMAESAIACGIQMNLGYYPASEWFADGPDGRLFGRAYDLGQFAWLTGMQPSCDLYVTSNIPGDPNALDAQGNSIYPNGWGGQNETGYSNPAYDAACTYALGLLPGEDGYIETHMEAQRIFSEELPVVPLYLRNKVAASRPDMCGFIFDSTQNSEFWNIEAFDYGENCP
jgi:peptide/nickel transport system substrate-binding protein